ncbi:MAG: LysM peptidoglycan-binding domain-containing protein [Halanaerobiales bacterium]|nr:LysM peptidoglycan-binding domain-containing protein [Halanaerobiales bacterium]
MKDYRNIKHKTDSKKKTKIIPMVILTMIVVTFCTFIILEGHVNSNDLVKYHHLEVQSGDTLWSLAKKFVKADEDIRDLIYQIRKINDLRTAEIHPGEIILIPTS